MNGEFNESVSGSYIDKISPISGEKMYDLPNSDQMDAVMAIKAANEAFEKWSETEAEIRSQILMRVAELIDENADALAIAET
ncbi:aldehyde dehydrogenase family protein, partial [Vibrio parahaemolyticus]